MRLGIIARSDNTGLGNQTRELVNMLNPDKILLINSLNSSEDYFYMIHRKRVLPIFQC